jgi:hypothetical protein
MHYTNYKEQVGLPGASAYLTKHTFKKHDYTHQDPHIQDRLHQPRTTPTTAQKVQMTQHQHLHKFTSLPKSILFMYLHIHLQVTSSIHLDPDAQNTNPPDHDPQPIHAHTWNHQDRSNVSYSTWSVKQATTNPFTRQTTPQNKHVPPNPHPHYCRSNYLIHLCRKNKSVRPRSTTNRLHNTRVRTKMQMGATKQSRPQQARVRNSCII